MISALPCQSTRQGSPSTTTSSPSSRSTVPRPWSPPARASPRVATPSKPPSSSTWASCSWWVTSATEHCRGSMPRERRRVAAATSGASRVTRAFLPAAVVDLRPRVRSTMSDQTPPTPDADQTAALPPVAPEIPAVDVPPADVPAAEAGRRAAQWPAQGYPPPPDLPGGSRLPGPGGTCGTAHLPGRSGLPGRLPAARLPGGRGCDRRRPATRSSPSSWPSCRGRSARSSRRSWPWSSRRVPPRRSRRPAGASRAPGLVTASRIVSWVNIGLWSAMLVDRGLLPRPGASSRAA